MDVGALESLLNDGITLINDADESKSSEGLAKLREAANAGAIEAYLHLGKYFEKSGKYDEAATNFEIGLKHRHRASIYRLAMLHGNQKVSTPDEKFFLKTIKKLSHEGHIPSVAQYSRLRIRGKYGSLATFIGLLTFIPNFLKSILLALYDHDSWRFKQ